MSCGSREAQIDRGSRSIVLISVDTLRADHLGSYGYARPTSPNLDRFASEDAVLFEQVFTSGGGTLPSHVSLFTGLPSLVHGVTAENRRAVDPNHTTLAEALSASGYETAAFTGGAFVKAKYGLDQGFDLFDDEGGDFEIILPKAISWLDENRDNTFFLFLHTYDVHSDAKRLPYDAPEGFNATFTSSYQGDFDGCALDECSSKLLLKLNDLVLSGDQDSSIIGEAELEFIVGLYDGGIAYVDSKLKLLFDHLRQLGLYDDAIIVVTSDHGEEFLEHRLFLHVQSYEELTRIPLLLKLPDQQFGGRRIQGLTSIVDIAPTLLDLVGLQPKTLPSGRSLVPRIVGTADGRRDVLVYGGLERLRTGQWSLYVIEGRPVQLFDLKSDPTESENVLHKHPREAARLLRIFQDRRSSQLALRDRLGSAEASAEVQISPEELERLEALGYVD